MAASLSYTLTPATLQLCTPATLQPCDPATLQPCNSGTLLDAAIGEVIRQDRAAEEAWLGIKTEAAVIRRRDQMRSDMLRAIGPFPERGDLDVRVVGTVVIKDCRVEKLLFASRPNHHVTAHLFLPRKGKAPYPVILMPCGHDRPGKLSRNHQRAAVVAAREGFAALLCDPLDQGERLQHPSQPEGCVHGHVNAGLRAHLLGWGLAQFRVWDLMRAIDLLESRPDIDKTRIGVAGMSGGGTLSAYLFLLDDRIKAACPMGFLTDLTSLVTGRGPQDSEQIVFGQLAFGLNHLSFMLGGYPRPICPGFTYDDFFPFAGSQRTFADAAALYGRFGHGDRIDHLECPGRHGWYESEKLGQVLWMHQALSTKYQAPSSPFDREALNALNAKQNADDLDYALAGLPEGTNLVAGVMGLENERSVYDILADEAERQYRLRGPLTRETVRKILGEPLAVPTGLKRDEARRQGYWFKRGGEGEQTAAVLAWLGRNYLANRVAEIVAAAKSHLATHGERMALKANGEDAVAAAHAYFLEPDLFASIEITNPPPSWRELLEDPSLRIDFRTIVYGALKAYDWTDLLPKDNPQPTTHNPQPHFLQPPREAKPQTWYHMMNGNVTKAGITRDFEALAEAGFGGVQMFDVSCDIPRGELDFNSPAWFDMLRHAAAEARRLGLEICVPNCSGFSSSGGPWIAPSNAMKRVVVSETSAKGGARISTRLPRTKDDHGFYADIAVLAFPVPPADAAAFPGVTETCTGNTAVASSAAPFSFSSLSYRLDYPSSWSSSARTTVEVSDDGTAFRTAETFETVLTQSGIADHALRFHNFAKPVTARAVRITFESPDKVTVREFHPEQRLRLADIRGKTFATRSDIRREVAAARPDQVVPKDAVIDLTAQLAADGTLEWDAPAGDWKILRIGCVCNGKCNHPASACGKGLEVDKLSAAAMDYHFEQYVARICRTLGPLAGNVETGLNMILVDSYEVGSQNWTQGFERIFRERRGYDLKPYLPVFSGYVVGSVEESERFLEDFRRVVADLFAENYAGKLASKCHEYGLKCSIEPYGDGPFDDLQYGQCVDVPMGEFWSRASTPYSPADGNVKFVSCVSHVWGRKVTASESFTTEPSPTNGRWMTTPFGLKAQADLAYADGVNRIVFHRFAHQPWADDKYLPGMTMGRWGMHLDRTQTWWPYAKPFFRYLARCQYMLQRGTFVADMLYFSGEAAPQGGAFVADVTDDAAKDAEEKSALRVELPFGYDWDVCPTDAMHALKVVAGEVVVPGGVRYRILVMPSAEAMTPTMLRTVAQLQREGAKIAWKTKPVRAPGLSFGAAGDAEVRRLADEIFSNGILRMPVADAIKSLDVQPQIAVLGELPKDVKKLNWIHRREKGTDWFFVAMPNCEPAALELSFRACGREPELWDAESGKIEAAEVWRMEGGRTIVRVPFDVCGSKFVVFRKPTAATRSELDAPRQIVDSVTTVTGPWQVSFPHGFLPNPLARGADEVVAFAGLEPWNERAEDGVRYFSGSATYRKEIAVPEMREGARLILELGRVCEVAEVTVNGKTFDALWHPPFSVDITDALQQSNNQTLSLSIRVANLWANRLIGDDRQFAPDCRWKGCVWEGVKEIWIRQIPDWVKEGKKSPTGRCTFTTWKHWDKNDELLSSGLLGPVKLHVRYER